MQSINPIHVLRSPGGGDRPSPSPSPSPSPRMRHQRQRVTTYVKVYIRLTWVAGGQKSMGHSLVTRHRHHHHQLLPSCRLDLLTRQCPPPHLSNMWRMSGQRGRAGEGSCFMSLGNRPGNDNCMGRRSSGSGKPSQASVRRISGVSHRD